MPSESENKKMFRELRRKNKVLPQEQCLALLREEKRGILSVLGEEDYPYGMPMNHYYNEADGALYFHCGRGGHRLMALERSDKVSFCVCRAGIPVEGEWAEEAQSVVVFGRMRVLEDLEQIAEISAKLSRKFTKDEEYIRSEIKKFAKATLLLRLEIEHICGKKVMEA